MDGHGVHDHKSLLVKPLSTDLRNGQIGVSVLAAISTLATFSLICYLTYRLLFWQVYQKQYLGQSQYIILIFNNLLLADIVQSIGFLVCAYWAVKDEIRAHTVACHLQGMSLHIGDPASGLFILAIAIHTFALVITGKKTASQMVCGGYSCGVGVSDYTSHRSVYKTWKSSFCTRWCLVLD
ncbi:hypothetical protein VTN31DRAFT_5899 [Thermomyces dupontii]|uniref:uncharacterized protein n=1 Tax=Talaromyces thermophilus TaxID=28565 RepID=UPI00374347DA